jgi:hypothetical protein
VLAGLAFTVIAVAIGAAVGLLTGIDLVAVRPEYLLGPLVAGFGLAILGRRWLTHPSGLKWGWTQHFQIAGLVFAVSCALVLTAEWAVTGMAPSTAGLAASVGLGLVYAGGWLGQVPLMGMAKFAVLALYAAAAVTASATLMTALPPSAFWVVSALIPAWQARKYSKLDELGPAMRFIRVATQIFIAILLCALAVPVLLSLR